MTIQYLAANIIIGLSSDTKPTNVTDKSIFIETDTKRLFILNSGVWNYEFITTYIDDLEDVTIDSPLYNNIIRYNGTNWINSIPLPSENPLLKSGEWYPLQTSDYSTGILSDSLVVNGIITRSTDSQGRKTTMTTDSTAANPAGLYQTIARYRREFDSKLYCYWLGASGSSNTQYYIGFTASSTLPGVTGGDAPLDGGIAGVLIMLRSVDNGSPPGTLKVAHNDATDDTVIADTGIAYGGSATYHKVEIHTSSSDVKIFVDDQLTNTLTSDIPAITTPLYPYWLVRRPGGGEKPIDIYKAGVVTK
jgi:hypothetical protein